MRWIFLAVFNCFSLTCSCQDKVERKPLDSISILSRKKADSVLSSFDNIQGMKMLYSVQDTHFYILIKKENDYKEYYIFEDKPSHFKTIQLEAQNKDRKLFSKVFILKSYHTSYITTMPQAKFNQGYPSYFVIKDKNGKRYGEFSLSYLTFPSPIDKVIYTYLIKKMADLSSIYINASLKN